MSITDNDSQIPYGGAWSIPYAPPQISEVLSRVERLEERIEALTGTIGQLCNLLNEFEASTSIGD